MPIVYFLVGGTSVTRVGMVAAELHQSQPFVEECPQEMIPALAGRRMFRVMYGDGRDIEKDDVEIIRKDLERGLNTKAWSATFDDNGRITWYPQQIGLDALPAASGSMYEDDPSPGDYDGGDWGGDWDGDIDGDDDEDLDGDWGHGFPEFAPPPHGRGMPYANVYGQSDRYQHIPEPLPRRAGPRNPFTNNFDPRGRYQPNPEPFPHRSGPRSPYTNNFDPRGRYQPTPEPIPRRNNRRTSFANDRDRDYQYEDFAPRGANNNRRRHTFGPEDDGHGRFAQAWGSPPPSPHPRSRGHSTRDEVLEEDFLRRGYRLAPGMPPPLRNRDGTPWELSMRNPRTVPHPSHERLTAIQNSFTVRGRTQRRSRSGRFWRVVRSFFGHTS